MTSEYPSLEEFLQMEDKAVADIVSSSPVGQAGTLIFDGGRRLGMLFYGLDPSEKDSLVTLFSILQSGLLRVIKIFFENGVRALYLPLMLHMTFDRGQAYMDASMEGLKYVLHDPKWLSFYNKRNIRVKCYGDREYIKQKGYPLLLEWMQELEERTDANDGANIFIGIACCRSLEEFRLSLMGIDFYKKLGRSPTRAELVQAYFGMNAPDVGFLVRSCELRDSDLQPVLVTGPKTQMYFPMTPLASLSKRTVRYILHDLIFNRIASKGLKMYSKVDVIKADTSRMGEYYRLNRDSVLGLGIREGSFWVPNNQIRMPAHVRNTNRELSKE